MNPIRGEAELRLSDGRILTLVMDMEAMVSAEASYGKPMTETMADAGKGFLGAVRCILHGALAQKHPEITREEALLILQRDTAAVNAALQAAGAAAFPDATGEGKQGENPPGKASGRRGARQG